MASTTPTKRWNSPNINPKYRDLEEMLDLKGFLCCVEEPYGFPQDPPENAPRIKEINYGHVVGVLNEADKNEWDVVFPGVTIAMNLVVCDEVIGYIKDVRGNHKLIGICYSVPTFSEEEFYKQLRAYTRKRKDIYDNTCEAILFKKPEEITSKIYTDY